MVVREHYQTGEINHDIVGEYFKSVFDKLDGPSDLHIEVKNYNNSDTRVSLLWYKNKVKAFVIETRNDFNNIELVKGEID